jgi:hypothetical protein
MEECIICFHETDEFAYFPCTHKVCEMCLPKLPTQLCPICDTSLYEAKLVEEIQVEPELVESVNVQTDNSFLELIKASCCIIFITIGMYSIIIVKN